MLDLEAAQMLLDVVQYGSFSRAAEELFVSKSTVKKRMDHLEKCMGTQLLNRSAKGVELTAAGQLFAERIAGVLRTIHDLEVECVKVAKVAEKRIIKVAYYSDFVFPMIQYCCDHYAAKHPSDTILPVFTAFSNARNGLRNGLFDVAFCPKAAIENTVDLASTPLYANRMGAMVRWGSELSGKVSLSRYDLAENEVVVHPMWCPQEEIGAWSKTGEVAFDVTVNKDGTHAMQSVCGRDGIYLYPESDGAQFPYAFLPLDDPILSWATIIYDTSPQPAVMDFVVEAVEYFKSFVDPSTMLLLTDWSHRPQDREIL